MDISRQTLFGKLNATLFKSLESATVFCKLRGNPHVELLHWLHQLFQGQDNDCARMARHCRIDTAVLDRDFAAALNTLPSGASSISDFSTHVLDAVERAWVYATLAFGDNRIRGAYLLTALVKTPELRSLLLGISSQFRAVPVDDLAAMVPSYVQGSPEEAESAFDGSALGMGGVTPGEASQATTPACGDGSALARFCTDLTERAHAGQIDPVVGRELEIRSMIDILLRRRQNNPLLTGDAGVGKTAIVEGFALALARGEVPPSLRDVRLLALDVGGLLAGASMKGEFESRLRTLIEEAGRSLKPVILFVDEVHTLVGAGGSQGTGDAANLLKPALARGTLRTIGATTWSEYKKHIEKDPALTRRFQVLQVSEPDEDTAVEMVRGLVSTFETHHKVLVLDEAVRAAVRLSARYIPSRQLPDKAISLLDTACARVALSLSAPPASVDDARRRHAALEVERQLLDKELAVSPTAESVLQERRKALETELAAVTLDLDDKERLWQEQSALVENMLNLRAQLLPQTGERREDAPIPTPPSAPMSAPEGGSAPEADPAACKARLAVLERELAAMQQTGALVCPEVDAAVVAGIVADWTGIPVGRMLRDEMRAVLELPDMLRRRVLGQDHALHALTRRIQTARAQLTDPDKPVGVFLLAGPSGVGKTETALALAEALYGGEQNLITVNMSEFQEAHTVSTLKGAPPGYVGYGEGGVLTEAVRRRPHSVILLDEIEKAHQDVYEIFYQVFDKGWMEDGEGRYIDFKNTVILLTTNVGAELTATLCEDPDLTPAPDTLGKALLPELRKVFSAAFLGRLAVVPYYPLAPDSLSGIVALHLERVRRRLQRHHGMELEYDDNVIQAILDRCDVAETGARLIISHIDQQVLPEISRLWLRHLTEAHRCRRLRLTVENEDIVCNDDTESERSETAQDAPESGPSVQI